MRSQLMLSCDTNEACPSAMPSSHPQPGQSCFHCKIPYGPGSPVRRTSTRSSARAGSDVTVAQNTNRTGDKRIEWCDSGAGQKTKSNKEVPAMHLEEANVPGDDPVPFPI